MTTSVATKCLFCVDGDGCDDLDIHWCEPIDGIRLPAPPNDDFGWHYGL